ncbi:hypothetical protein DSO57_1030428 [Entomophthora muscae]|uniref:Uncharacterized protein n=1 Tax=Entomophthora muscae TaxID=34485 RepID=A0ACC2TZ76_9FUNG|nr:hypothetical protein DSO57_1030428 [Entomophthora muscae]
MSDPKSNSHVSRKTLSDLAENVFADSVCCGIPLLGMRSVVEHVEEYHSQPCTGNGEVGSLDGFTFPTEINYEACENLAPDDSIPDITFEECCSQLLDNFRKYGINHQGTLTNRSLDNTCIKLPTPVPHSFTSQKAATNYNHCTDLKSVGATPPKPITGASRSAWRQG